MSTLDLFVYCLIMATVTYLIRMLPLILINKKIDNKFIQSFLHYMPYAVLSALVIPSIFISTGSYLSGVLGFVVAFAMSMRGRGLFTVAVFTCLCVFVVDNILCLI